MSELTDIYDGIDGKILVYHGPYYYNHAYFFRIISRTKYCCPSKFENKKEMVSHEERRPLKDEKGNEGSPSFSKGA